VDQKIIEYRLRDPAQDPLAGMSLTAFAHETASESPAPGGGSVAAYVGALGAALSTMVANLSAHKRGWDERWEEFSRWAVRGEELKKGLLQAVDEDTRAFNAILEAYRLGEGSEEEKEKKARALEEANRRAIDTPFQVMKLALDSMDVAEAMARLGNPASVSDAGVGALCARAAVRGAYLNVKINAAGQPSSDFLNDRIESGQKMVDDAQRQERKVLELVEESLAGEQQ
jgi:glutamate formiminotransferase/formiminotetrahydrofolate cyclodeaminase